MPPTTPIGHGPANEIPASSATHPAGKAGVNLGPAPRPPAAQQPAISQDTIDAKAAQAQEKKTMNAYVEDRQWHGAPSAPEAPPEMLHEHQGINPTSNTLQPDPNAPARSAGKPQTGPQPDPHAPTPAAPPVVHPPSGTVVGTPSQSHLDIHNALDHLAAQQQSIAAEVNANKAATESKVNDFDAKLKAHQDAMDGKYVKSENAAKTGPGAWGWGMIATAGILAVSSLYMAYYANQNAKKAQALAKQSAVSTS